MPRTLLRDHKIVPVPGRAAVVELGAMQCGYCIPGMIMSGIGLLRKNPNPTESEILNFMEGNLCRCGTYPRILAAIRLAVAAQKGSER